MRGILWSPERSPEIPTYLPDFYEEWFLIGAPKLSIRIYGYSVIDVVSMPQMSDSGDAGNPFIGF
jgi:hypothetical protein